MHLRLLSTGHRKIQLVAPGSRNCVGLALRLLHSASADQWFTDKVIPRQMFEVPIQATIGRKVIARETLSAMRADVTAGLYGGHYERKMKHLNNQKEGKKKMKMVGTVELPQEAFFDMLSNKK